LNFKLDAQGTVAQLSANLDLQMRELKVLQLSTLEPATFDASARLQNNQLVLTGKLQQAKIKPVQIDAKFPLNVSKLIETKKLDEQTPLTASVRMPRSSVCIREFRSRDS
jgi:hypothetical protein